MIDNIMMQDDSSTQAENSIERAFQQVNRDITIPLDKIEEKLRYLIYFIILIETLNALS
jgi:hypothetical protein